MSLNKVVNTTDYALDGKFREMKLTGGFEVDGASTLGDIKCEDVNCNDIVGNDINTNTGDIDVLQCISVNSQAVRATGLLTNEKEKVVRDAAALYALSAVAPVGFVGNPSDLTATFELKGVESDGSVYEMLAIRGNFSVLCGIPAAPGVPVSYTMTITDPAITASFLDADVVYQKGVGIGSNGAGADSGYLTSWDTSVAGQVSLTFTNISHNQTPQGFNVVNKFEIHLLQPVPP